MKTHWIIWIGGAVLMCAAGCATPGAGGAPAVAETVQPLDETPIEPSKPRMEPAPAVPEAAVLAIEPGPEPEADSDPLCELQSAWRRATPEQKEEFRRWMKTQPEPDAR
ncbi:MAG: hypothetical protein KBA51_03230 [Kiritimatiellae bacterium]|nr:hypothetical protein [Kiritimatiellia bacterium]